MFSSFTYFSNILCAVNFRPEGLLVYRLCLPPDTSITYIATKIIMMHQYIAILHTCQILIEYVAFIGPKLASLISPDQITFSLYFKYISHHSNKHPDHKTCQKVTLITSVYVIHMMYVYWYAEVYIIDARCLITTLKFQKAKCLRSVVKHSFEHPRHQ